MAGDNWRKESGKLIEGNLMSVEKESFYFECIQRKKFSDLLRVSKNLLHRVIYTHNLGNI